MAKKNMAVMLITVVVCGMISLSGCMSKNLRVAETEEMETKIMLTFMTFKRETRHIFEQIIEDFNNSQDEIYIEQVVAPNPDEELKIRAVQGELPDMIEFIGAESDVFGQYIDGGYLSPITEFDCIDRVYPQFLEKLKTGDDYYILPLSVNYRGIFINTEMMEENGYQIPESYESLIETMEQMKQNGETAMLFPDEDSWSIHQGWDAIDTVSRGIQAPLFQAAAEGIRSLDQDLLAVETTKKFLEIRKYGQPNALGTGYDEAVKAFASGEAYMFLQGNWAYSLIKKLNPELDVVFAPFPVEEGKKPEIVVKIDSSIGISASCEDSEAAEIFLEYLLSDEVSHYYASEAGAYSCVADTNRQDSYDEAFVTRIEEGSFSIEPYTFFNDIDEERNELFRKLVSQPEKYPIEDFLQDLSEMLNIHQQGLILPENE